MKWLAYSIAIFALSFSGLCEQIPIDAFSKKPYYTQAKLSPDGRHAAVLVPWSRRQNLAVIDLETRKGMRLTAIDTQDIATFHWVNNNRLVFATDDNGNEAFGLFAVNKDGTEARTLAAPGKTQTIEGRAVLHYTVFASRINNNPDEILVLANDRFEQYPDVYRMNIHNGRRTLLTFDSPGNVTGWIFDNNQQLRVAIAQEKGFTRVYYRKDQKAPWSQLIESKHPDKILRPLAFTDDNKMLLVAATVGRDKAAVYSYNPESKQLGKLLFQHEEADVDTPILDPYTHRLLGYSVITDRARVHWTDATYKRLQEQIDATFKNNESAILSVSRDGSHLLVRDHSDVNPGAVYLLQVNKRTLEKIGSIAEWLPAEQLARAKPVRYRVRDAADARGYLSLPLVKEGKKLPAVVYVKAKASTTDLSGFNPMVQFLANRGYAVLHTKVDLSFDGQEAPFANLTHAVNGAREWLIEEDIADPERICIFGTEDAAYVALLDFAKPSPSYRCAIGYFGNTDSWFLYQPHLLADDAHSTPASLGIGTDASKLRSALSVDLRRSGPLDIPLLKIHGTQAPQAASPSWQELNNQLRKNRPQLIELIRDNEGLGFRKEENASDLYRQVETFLAKHLRNNKT